MKNLGWKRKLAATLLSLGLLSPTAYAQCTINTDQVVNGGFESVDNSVSMGGYNAVLILDWTAPTGDGYAYSHDGSLNAAGEVIPDFSNAVTPFTAGESFYFTAGANAPDNSVSNPLQQILDVSTGTCGPLISSGAASYSLSAFFSSFATQGDFGTVQVEFLDGGGGVLRSASITDSNTNDWTQSATAGVIPSSTQSVRVSAYGTALAGSADGYIDNVEFQVTDELVLPVLDIEVDRDTGGITLTNRTGGNLNMSGYSITSAIEGVDPSNSTWLSIADNYDADNDQSVDPNNVWSELTDPSSFTDLSEADLDSGLGTTLMPDQMILLSASGGWIKNPFEDLVFEYVSDLTVVQGIVNFTGNNDRPYALGDLNVDGALDGTDWLLFVAGLGTDLSALTALEAYTMGDLNLDSLNNHADFLLFGEAYDQENGAGAFARLLNTPEPGSTMLVFVGGLVILGACRKGWN